jgi:eukaryotic-like serine/threonine-protein kinase
MGGTLKPGEILNNTYIIEELIAIGGTGEVYRARNRASDREIAIKILRREFAGNQTFLDLMRREASVLHEVQDDAVVRYYDILHSDAHGGFIFLVMEFIRGESLADRMQRGPVDEDTCLTVARRVAQGLKASHDKKAYHRDLSPDNVILRDGDPARSVLIDFGIAKDVNEDARTVIGGGFAGKYQYAAPEQIDGHADGRSDIYSLGMTLVGAFRGRPPVAGASYLELIRTKGEKPDIADLPGRLRALVDRLTDPDPDKRLQTPDAVLDFLGEGPGSPERPRTVPPATRQAARPRAGRPTGAAAAGRACGSGCWCWSRRWAAAGGISASARGARSCSARSSRSPTPTAWRS